MRLGPLQIDHPFILAPMAGITDSPFRRLMRRHSCALVVSELISANGIEYGGQKTLEYLRFNAEERPLGLQVFGEDAENLSSACRRVEAAGADFVDINLGCPVPKVVKKGAGASLCRNVPALAQMLGAAVRSVKIPLTIKIRSGWDESSRNALEVVRAAADVGVTWVAIHGRTRAQGYSGSADWDFIGNVKSKSPIPIIGNGDVASPEDGLQKFKTYGVDAVMVGRGILRNPFLFQQLHDLWRSGRYELMRGEDLIRLIEEQRQLYEEFFDLRKAMIQWRKFLAWYSAGLPGCHEFRKMMFEISDAQELSRRAREFFEKFSQQNLRIMGEGHLPSAGHG